MRYHRYDSYLAAVGSRKPETFISTEVFVCIWAIVIGNLVSVTLDNDEAKHPHDYHKLWHQQFSSDLRLLSSCIEMVEMSDCF